jgi:hypothetical protein
MLIGADTYADMPPLQSASDSEEEGGVPLTNLDQMSFYKDKIENLFSGQVDSSHFRF